MAVADGVSLAIRPARHDDHVRVEFDGEFSLDAVLPLCVRCFEVAVVRIAELQASYKPRVRVALVGNEPLVHPERFGEIVAARHGADLRVFTDESLALGWLLGRVAEP